MTDKEIIIDGVDVSKCIHIDNWKHCNCCNDLIKTIYPKASQCLIEEDLRCEIYSNCYYKQLKHQEQKNENLNEVTIEQRKENTELTIKLGKMINRGGELCGELQKYKQALDEIEKIANKQRKFDLTGKTPLISVINEVGEDFIDILNIINKAKESKQ